MLRLLSRRSLFYSLIFSIAFISQNLLADRHHTPMGTIVRYISPKTNVFLGTPSLARSPCGDLLISYDTFGKGSKEDTTYVMASKDDGRTWYEKSSLGKQYWSSIFTFNEEVFLLGVTSVGGSISLRKSRDCGSTWTEASSPIFGRLMHRGHFFSAATPAILKDGLLLRAFEIRNSDGLYPVVLSIPLDSNLLDTRHWKISSSLRPNPSWLSGKFKGWLEGNVVLDQTGDPKVILRTYYNATPEKVAIANFDTTKGILTFNPELDFVDFPGGGKKFSIRRDPVSHKYLALSNIVSDPKISHNFERVRNTLALISSDDLRQWHITRILLHHPDHLGVGYQYADWQIDGADLIAAVRTAHPSKDERPPNQHDSNFITFHRFSGFRDWLQPGK